MLAGTYQVEDIVGRPSGMGQVYSGHDVNLNRRVALKVPALEVIASREGSERFLREARLAASLKKHPHIVEIYSCLSDPAVRVSTGPRAESAPVPFIAMEYLGGGDLEAHLRPGGMPLDRVAALADALCLATQHAHRHEYQVAPMKTRLGIVHRDLKPKNICFDDTGRLVVVDFGLARLQEDSFTFGGVVGTPPYMAPEQWSPTMGIDHRTDIYALGVVLFEMCTGNRPFEEREPEKLMAAHMSTTPADPRRIRPDLPSKVAHAILRALEKQKDERFESSEQLRLALAEGFGGTREARASMHRRRGDTFARTGKYRDAVAEYDQAISMNPTEVDAFVNRGFCWHRQGLNQQALADLTYALHIDPMHSEAFNTRGMALKELGRYDEAIDDFENTLALDPDHPLASNNILDTLRLKSRRP